MVEKQIKFLKKLLVVSEALEAELKEELMASQNKI